MHVARRRVRAPGRGRNLQGGPDVPKRTCSIPGCGNPHNARGLCRQHYCYAQRDGWLPAHHERVERPWTINNPKEQRRKTLADRFWEKVDKTETCWNWMGYLFRGYGRFHADPELIAHRFAYELLVGPIPEGMTLDHLCHNADPTCAGGPTCAHRRCVNPVHLEPVTSPENSSRRNPRTHCPAGHPYSEANTYHHPRGDLVCLICRREASRRYKARKRAERSV